MSVWTLWTVHWNRLYIIGLMVASTIDVDATVGKICGTRMDYLTHCKNGVIKIVVVLFG